MVLIGCTGWTRRSGRFVSGQLPALGVVVERDNYLDQAGATLALARAGRFAGEPRYVARATQSLLLLLEDTAVDPNDPRVRYTCFPSTVLNRLAAAGLLVMAINELPAPQRDLLDKSEQLCNFIRRQQQADGSLCCTDDATDASLITTAELINHNTGLALSGLMHSQIHQPAGWKTEVVHKALAYYAPWWRRHKNMAFIPWQTAAYAEAYLRTQDPAYADFVNEMNDWLCGLQYDRLDPRQALWFGGFKNWVDDKAVENAPDVGSASYAESLVEACRVAREAGDRVRYERYSSALERCLQFLATLQFTDANTRHFADWYLPTVQGAYHASHHDGNMRLDYTQHVLCAQVQYLTYVVRSP